MALMQDSFWRSGSVGAVGAQVFFQRRRNWGTHFSGACSLDSIRFPFSTSAFDEKSDRPCCLGMDMTTFL